MKKVFVFVLAMSILMSLSGIAMAQEATVANTAEAERAEADEAGLDIDPDAPVVGDDVLIDDGEMKIVSVDEEAEEKDRMAEQEAADARELEAAAPDEPSEGGGVDPVVDPEAEDLAADGDIAVEDAVVGDDIEIGDDEAKIVSVDEDAERVVGDDLDLGEDEAGIVSVDESADEDESNSLTMIIIVAAAILVGAGLIFIIKKVMA